MFLRDDFLLLLQKLVLSGHLLDPLFVQLVLLAHALHVLLPIVRIHVPVLPRLRLLLHFSLIVELELLDSLFIVQDGVLKVHLFLLLLRPLLYVLSLFDCLQD